MRIRGFAFASPEALEVAWESQTPAGHSARRCNFVVNFWGEGRRAVFTLAETHMDAAHERLSRLFPSLAEIREEAQIRAPGLPELQGDIVSGILEALYGEARRRILADDERAARQHPPIEDEEDDTEDVDYGEPVARALPVDPEAVFPAAAAAPTLATDVTRREVKVCDRSA